MNDSNQTLKDLTLADLEQLIINIVERTLKKTKEAITPAFYESLINTFGAWEDDRNDQEIIAEIYSSRNNTLNSI
ncbi:MAG: hypothetical protein ACRC2J_15090 [Microcoleaceae cyanobacterium]